MRTSEEIYKEAEKRANKFNMYGLLFMALLAIIVIILGATHLFPLDKEILLITMGGLIINAIAPFMIYLFHDIIFKSEISVFEKSFYKNLIIIITFYIVIDLGISLSFHAILLLAVPILVAAQYKSDKNVFIFITIASIVMVPITLYGNYFFGNVYDANLLKPLTAAEAENIQNRIDIATSSRMWEIFFHYAVPRMITLAAIEYLAITMTGRTTEMLHTQIDLNNKVQEQMEKRTNLQSEIIFHLADVIESRDIETGEHIKRTKRYVSILAHAMQKDDRYEKILTKDYVQRLEEAAPLHDIGKIVVSDLILCKPGKLTDEEFEKMKIHTTKGGEIIKNILHNIDDKKFLNMAYDVATTHHEKWNGKGYPNGLKEEEIPLSGRIMAVADVFDALVAERVYKKPIPVEDAINIIINDAGTHFDPNIIEIFKKVTVEFKEASQEKLIDEER
ncbi:MAG: HD domain-containing protein [Acholeplasmatales bacterium]|nr:HD domain-containing protein [Acholeplasmatales bacterium]